MKKHDEYEPCVLITMKQNSKSGHVIPYRWMKKPTKETISKSMVYSGGRMVSINCQLEKSRITWEMGLWSCLCGFYLMLCCFWNQEVKRDECWSSACFLLFIHYNTTVHEWCCPHSGWIFLSLLGLLGFPSQIHHSCLLEDSEFHQVDN